MNFSERESRFFIAKRTASTEKHKTVNPDLMADVFLAKDLPYSPQNYIVVLLANDKSDAYDNTETKGLIHEELGQKLPRKDKGSQGPAIFKKG